jgi:small-conductance mechanosensitive channel
MLQQLARALQLSPLSFYLISGLALLLVGLGLGFALRRVFHRCAERYHERNGWAEFVFALLEALPIPLLILAALYVALKFLTLPHRYDRLGSELISSLAIMVVYIFPARVIVLFLRRLGARKASLERMARFLIFLTRAAFVLLTLYTLQENLVLPRKYERFGTKVAETLAILLVFYALARMVSVYLERMREREPALQRLTDPANLVARVIFAGLAIIIILENFGVHLTAVWTTLGVGSVAVALALQETLSNLFAGLYLLADRPISPGDYVKLDSGQEGYVLRIGWRSTLIRTLANNVVIAPNSVMAKAVITNYSVPELRMGSSITVSVPFGTDPNRVERALIETARQAAEDGVEGLLRTPEPSARLIPGFGASSLDFSLNFQVRQFTDQYLVQSELRKRVVARFAQDGIEMPFPVRTVSFDQEARWALAGTKAAAEDRGRDLDDGRKPEPWPSPADARKPRSGQSSEEGAEKTSNTGRPERG